MRGLKFDFGFTLLKYSVPCWDIDKGHYHQTVSSQAQRSWEEVTDINSVVVDWTAALCVCVHQDSFVPCLFLSYIHLTLVVYCPLPVFCPILHFFFFLFLFIFYFRQTSYFSHQPSCFIYENLVSCAALFAFVPLLSPLPTVKMLIPASLL